MAFKATPDGQPQKLAAARFVSLSRDGKIIFQRDQPGDTAVAWTSDGHQPLGPGFGF